MKRYVMAGLFATICAGGTLAAQTTPTTPGAPPPAPAPRPGVTAPLPPTSSALQGDTTLVGCLYREDQIPGRTPNIVERAGVLEDYILADAAMATAPSGTPGATGTSGGALSAGNMYKVERIDDEQLKSLVGKRVEIMGQIDPQAGSGATGAPTPDRGLGPDDINLPEFEATSIREVAGTCPTTPASRTR